jgi:hypothetical protein
VTGEMRSISVYKEEGNYTYIPLHLNPEGSVFVVFKDQQPQKHIVKLLKDGREIFPGTSLAGSQFPAIECFNDEGKTVARIFQPGTYSLQWSDGSENSLTEGNPVSESPLTSRMNLKFTKPWGPEGSLTVNDLKSWTEFKDKKIRYYSGPAEYSATFYIDKDNITGKRVYLDLGNVQEIAEVQINDSDAGVSWISPFIIDITGFIKPGENKVNIIVVNSWVNRLIGDSYLIIDKRVTRTNVVKFEGKDKESYLRKSGLTDTVKLLTVSEKTLNH